MRSVNFARLAAVTIASYLLCFVSQDAFAGNRWVDGTQSSKLNTVVRNKKGTKIFLLDSGNNNLLVINTKTEKVVRKLPLSGVPADIALSKNDKFLAISTGRSITRINLKNFKAKDFVIPESVEGEIVSLAFGSKKNIFCGSSVDRQWGKLYLLDKKGMVINEFGVGPDLNQMVYCPLIKTDAKGRSLYIGYRGVSPTSIYKLDVTKNDKPVFIAEDEHGELGSNLRDFAISPTRNEIYVASGYPYGIQVVNSDNLRLISVLHTDAYPGSVDVSSDGKEIYGTATSPYNNFLYKFDAQNRQLIKSYPLLSEVWNGGPQPRGVCVADSGRKAFVIHGSDYYDSMQLQVVDTNM